MVFNSSIFLVFFILFFPLYWLINNRSSILVRNIFTILASYVFYGWWDWRFLSLIVISSLSDYLIGLQIDKSTEPQNRKLLLWCSILVNLGILGFFKYYNFFIDSLREGLSLFSISSNLSTLDIILPVGISFYTFQTLSYTIDIYRGKMRATNNPVSFFAFVSFFPQLVAGPIERASHLLGQFQVKKEFNYAHSVIGLRLVLWGFFKKVVIADNFGILADQCFQTDVTSSGLVILIGALCFGFQIYADFSGYSDIAIGFSKMLGFDLMKNFQTPYFSLSIGEYWRRWHISLSTWFRDYVYIPLGGNRGSAQRVAFNLMVTFLLSGLWHGAHVTFLIWAGIHGLLMIWERWSPFQIPKFLAWLQTFFIITLLWLPFRAVDLAHLSDLLNAVLSVSSYSIAGFHEMIIEFSTYRFIVLMLVLILFFGLEYRMRFKDFSEWIHNKSKWVRWGTYYLLIFTIIFLGNFAVKPNFIYFQF